MDTSPRVFLALRSLSVVLSGVFFLASLYALGFSLPEQAHWYGWMIGILGFFPFFVFLSFQGLLSRLLPRRIFSALLTIFFPYIFFFLFAFDVQSWKISLLTFSLAEYVVTISAMVVYAVRELREGGKELLLTAGIPYFFLCIPGIALLYFLVRTWWFAEGATLSALVYIGVILLERLFVLFPRLWREIERT